MSRKREIELLPICAAALSPVELKYQIDFLLEQYESALLKKELEDEQRRSGPACAQERGEA